MDRNRLKQVLYDQMEDMDTNTIPNLCHRKEEDMVELDSPLAQIVIGVRRCGKSTLCKNVLGKAKVKFGYVNFDDERLAELTTHDLDDVLMTLYQMHGEVDYFFFDEIQNIPRWALFVNRLLRQRKRLLITGSNSRLLATDLATHLTGRHNKIELHPFSFAEYCDYNRVKTVSRTTKDTGLLARAFDQYLQTGGMPELLTGTNSKAYIDALFESIIQQDIKRRFNVRNIESLRRLARHLLNISPAIIRRGDLCDILGIKSQATVSNYLSYLAQAYLTLPLTKFSNKSSERMQGEKVYAIDVAMMNQRQEVFVGDNLGWRLETIVYLELRRRMRYASQDIYYYATPKTECDFITADGNRVTGIYQVCYDMTKEKTRKREIAGCVSAAHATNRAEATIITSAHTETIVARGVTIHCIPAYEWLIEQEA
ncbi:MAG: ATP-binding protein [Bacteroidaceae bacterium]|nr:ATP-binding protein [Bacteroidaceae bacterium]